MCERKSGLAAIIKKNMVRAVCLLKGRLEMIIDMKSAYFKSTKYTSLRMI